jgi:uncharacterized protein YodC (DUF2158 family)
VESDIMAEPIHPFKPGDIVQLKSGGPKMTVVVLSDTVYQNKQWMAKCKWWNGGAYQDAFFSFEELDKAEA